MSNLYSKLGCVSSLAKGKSDVCNCLSLFLFSGSYYVLIGIYSYFIVLVNCFSGSYNVLIGICAYFNVLVHCVFDTDPQNYYLSHLSLLQPLAVSLFV